VPIPEPGTYRPLKFIPPPGVTEKQAKQDQLAACYGVTMPTQQLSESEISTMRQLLAQHDSGARKMTIHDLNNPPKAQYRYQKFPMMVYDLEHSYPSRDEQKPKPNSLGMETVHVPAKVVTKIVESEEGLQEAVATGWSTEAPTFTEERHEPLSAQYANEASRVDDQIEEQRAKRAYNRKVA
jgi:hypothetical protein